MPCLPDAKIRNKADLPAELFSGYASVSFCYLQPQSLQLMCLSSSPWDQKPHMVHQLWHLWLFLKLLATED